RAARGRGAMDRHAAPRRGRAWARGEVGPPGTGQAGCRRLDHRAPGRPPRPVGPDAAGPRAARRGGGAHLLLRPRRARLGRPLAGVWVSPHPAREAEAKQVTEQLGLSAETFSFTGPFAGIGAQRSLVEQAWHLGDLAARYQAFLARFEDLRPAPGDETLLAQ